MAHLHLGHYPIFYYWGFWASLQWEMSWGTTSLLTASTESAGNMMFNSSLLQKRVVRRKTLPHDICILMCATVKCISILLWLLRGHLLSWPFWLTYLCLFLIISRPESCFNVNLPLCSQFSCSFTPTRLCILQTRPLFEFAFFSHTCMSRAIFPFSGLTMPHGWICTISFFRW